MGASRAGALAYQYRRSAWTIIEDLVEWGYFCTYNVARLLSHLHQEGVLLTVSNTAYTLQYERFQGRILVERLLWGFEIPPEVEDGLGSWRSTSEGDWVLFYSSIGTVAPADDQDGFEYLDRRIRALRLPVQSWSEYGRLREIRLEWEGLPRDLLDGLLVLECA